MKLYIIRHGETDWNKEGKPQGQTDIELNEHGLSLAELTSDGLKDVSIDYIFSSPLKRAYKTAEILRRDRNIEIVCDERLKEVSFGPMEGSTKPEPELKNFFNDPEAYRAPKGAESFEDLICRTNDFLKEKIYPLAKENPKATVLISGHGAMNKALMLNLKRLSLKDIWKGPFQRNCCVNLYEVIGERAYPLEEGKIFYSQDNDPFFAAMRR